MKPLRPTGISLLMVAFGIFMSQGNVSLAWPGDARGPTLVVATTASADSSVVGTPTPTGKRPSALVDPQSVFFGCATGTVLGALVTALPPMVGWTFYAGALPAVVALIATSGVGCAVGLFGGVIISTFVWIFDKVGGAWHAVFG